MLLSATLLLAPSAAAQQRATVRWAPGSPSANGYESASIDVQYNFQSCDGELWISMGGMRSTMQTSDAYWYKGTRYPVPASAHPDWSSIHVDFGGDVLQQTPQGPRRVATFSYRTGPVYSSGCFNAINFTSLGKMATLFAPKLTSEERSAIIASLSVDARDLGRQLTNQSVEWAIDGHIRDSVYAVKQAERARLRLARNDSISKARAAQQAAAAARRDSAQARGAQATGGSTAGSTRGGKATGTAAGGTAASTARPSSTGRQTATAPAQTRAEREALAQQRADSVRRMLEEQQAAQQAETEATVAAVTGALTTTATIAQSMGAMFGGYYLTADEAPANSSYTIQTMSGFGAGISGRWAYVDGGMISMSLTDDYIAKAKARNSYAPDKEQSGYFVSGGLALEMPFEDDSYFGFAPSLGYTYITGGTEVTTGGVHAGFGVRLGGFKVRVDMGSGEYGSTYGIAGYLKL